MRRAVRPADPLVLAPPGPGAGHVALGLGAQRVLGLHLEHQVHAALQVEAEVDLLLRRLASRTTG